VLIASIYVATGPSTLYASTAANRDASCIGSGATTRNQGRSRESRAHGFIGILGALGINGCSASSSRARKDLSPAAVRHSRGAVLPDTLVENEVFLGKLGADLAASFGILGANRRQSRGI
jgi:hypothetical protein